MNKKAWSLNRILTLGALAICLFAALVIGLVFAHHKRNQIIDKADARLFSASVYLQEEFGLDFHDRIDGAESVSSGEFQRILDRNDRITRQLGLQYLWAVMVLDEDDIVFTSATRVDVNDPASAHASFSSGIVIPARLTRHWRIRGPGLLLLS